MGCPQIQQGAFARWSRARHPGRMISVHLREDLPLLLGTPRSGVPPMVRHPPASHGPHACMPPALSWERGAAWTIGAANAYRFDWH